MGLDGRNFALKNLFSRIWQINPLLQKFKMEHQNDRWKRLAPIENASMNDRVMYLSISCGECLIEIVIFLVDLFVS
jgi:hypothetical protein